MTQGEPNPAAIEEVEKANAQARELAAAAESDLQPLVDTAPVAKTPPATGAPPATNLAQLFREALSDPSVKATLRDVLTSDPELRDVLGIEAGRGAPSGTWNPNYNRVDNHVMGGLEVQHDPGFAPLPPAAVPVYVTAKRFLSTTKATTSLVHLAEKGPDGQPVKTTEYKRFLDFKKAGRQMTRNELIDLEKQAENGPQLAIGPDGAPMTVGADGAQVHSVLHDAEL